MSDTLKELAAVIEARKAASTDSSYVAGLFAKGMNTILKKVGEEAAETIIAAKEDDDSQLVHETADLWFHTLVMLSARGLGPEDVLAELERRFDVSGLASMPYANTKPVCVLPVISTGCGCSWQGRLAPGQSGKCEFRAACSDREPSAGSEVPAGHLFGRSFDSKVKQSS